MISTREYQYSPRSILVFSGRYHIISNASLVNNCIVFLFNGVLKKNPFTIKFNLKGPSLVLDKKQIF